MKKLLIVISFLLLFSTGYTQTGNNVLLEFCTGTWCQYCPCGDQWADTILVYRPNTLVLAYHGGSTSEPFQYFNGNTIINLMGYTGYPQASIGRRTGCINYPSWYGQSMIQSSSIDPSVSYSVNRHYNPATKTIDYTVIVTALRDIDTNCSINFVIYENNLIYSQTGNSGCPGSSAWVHKWVVRNMVNGATGEALSTGHWAQGTTKTKSWTTTLDNAWVVNNCDVGVFTYMVNSMLSYNCSVLQTKKETVNTFPTGISNQTTEPLKFKLAQNYPNPFNPKTNIHFSIPKDGNVKLVVYDIRGKIMQTLSDGFMKAGEYNAEIDGTKLASGVYFYKLSAGEYNMTKKMILAK